MASQVILMLTSFACEGPMQVFHSAIEGAERVSGK